MIDAKAISKTIISKLKQQILGKSAYGNSEWGKADDNWYTSIHDSNYLLHENFIHYLKQKTDVKTILEVGCGTGVYPIKYRELFAGKRYTGIDISQTNIDYCKKNSKNNSGLLIPIKYIELLLYLKANHDKIPIYLSKKLEKWKDIKEFIKNYKWR